MHNLFPVMLSTIMLSACGGQLSEIQSRSIDERTDVFREEPIANPVSPDLAELIIKAQFKTYLEGFYILESRDSPHGKQAYSFLINIDGQHAVWQMEGRKENTSIYDLDGKKTVEGGPGMRYALEKKIWIYPGVHHVFIALPGDHYYKEFQVSLNKNSTTLLELNPVYRRGSRRRMTYLEGISDFEIVQSIIRDVQRPP